MKNFFFRLIAIYKRLDESIRFEEKQPRPRDLRLLRMKRLRAAIRQRLNVMMQSPA